MKVYRTEKKRCLHTENYKLVNKSEKRPVKSILDNG